MNWRQVRNEPTISSESVGDYYSYFREFAEVFASHHSKQLEGKAILLYETFLTKRKYNRVTTSMTQSLEYFEKFVDKNDTINPLENENKHFKKSIVSRKTIYCYALLDHIGKRNLGVQIWQFIHDVKEVVHPGCLESGLEMIQIDKVLPEDVGIEHLIPDKNDDDSEETEWSDLEDNVYDLDWEKIPTGPAKKIRTHEGF
ncbi:hypothetical protein CDAR_397241 [Caerostris darwini]|uniref:Integrase SAM-like N-terminal domain-containing protein n=1 Tax=Caerostris darwini TaxID=1538125 RepID=A0AAV4U5J0_9ARAC|nr:hypothetical protein CDAR_397241 [Caerostris darwini]